jgi:capsular polysaccharide biosynthesis protein
MTLQQFVMLALRGWWVILLAVLVTVGSTAFFVSRQAPEYRASTTVELIPHIALNPNDVVDVYNLLDKRNLSNTLARKAEGTSMVDLVATRLGVDPSVVSNANVSAVVLPDSNIIEIKASSSDPNLAAAISNTVADEMLGQTPDKILQIESIDAATPPSTPIAPQPTRMLVLALFTGLVLGLMFVLIESVIRGQAGSGTSWLGGHREPAVALNTGTVPGSIKRISDQ